MVQKSNEVMAKIIVRAGLHYASWKRIYSMVRVHGPTFIIRLHIKIVLKALGPSLGVNRMWTKKNDHAPKSECVDFF